MSSAKNHILTLAARLTPMDGSDVSRELEMPWMGQDLTLAAELNMRLAFSVELAPSGTAGTVPRWGALLRACGCAQVVTTGVSVTYNPVTDSHESATIYLWIGGTRYVLRMSRGNARFEVSAQGIPMIAFDLRGLFSQPTDVTRVTPTFTSYPVPQLASDSNTPTFTLGGSDFILRNLTFDLGNKVEQRLLINSEEIWITDKAETVEWQMEAVPLATWNPYSLAAGQTTVAAVLSHGTGAGKISTLSLPQLRVQRPQITGAQGVKEWSLRGIPIPITGNDQWTLYLT